MPEVSEAPRPAAIPEIPRFQPGETLIFIQRHGRYDSRRPESLDNITEEARVNFGRISGGPTGKENLQEAAGIADARIEAMFAEDPDKVRILVVASPTFWLDNPAFGQRAVETGQIIVARIKKYLEVHGLSSDHLLNKVEFEESEINPKGEPKFLEGNVHIDERLGEALMFQVPQFANYLRQEYGGQGPKFWENFNRDTHRKVRVQMQAEGPSEAGARVATSLDIEALFANKYHQEYPENKLVIWNITHGDGLEPLVQKVIRAPEESFEAGYNAGFGIKIDQEGNAVTVLKGIGYRVPLYSSDQISSSIT